MGEYLGLESEYGGQGGIHDWLSWSHVRTVRRTGPGLFEEPNTGHDGKQCKVGLGQLEDFKTGRLDERSQHQPRVAPTCSKGPIVRAVQPIESRLGDQHESTRA